MGDGGVGDASGVVAADGSDGCGGSGGGDVSGEGDGSDRDVGSAGGGEGDGDGAGAGAGAGGGDDSNSGSGDGDISGKDGVDRGTGGDGSGGDGETGVGIAGCDDDSVGGIMPWDGVAAAGGASIGNCTEGEGKGGASTLPVAPVTPMDWIPG